MRQCQAAQRARVLVVEDDEAIRDLLRIALGMEGFEVVTAVDGVAALDLVGDSQAPHPDVILLDTLMPRLDGRGFLRAYRRLPLRHAAVISIGFGGSSEWPDEPLAVDGILVKPFDLEQLLSLIKGHAARIVAARAIGAAR